MFGAFQPAFRYDASLRKASQPNGASWRMEGKTVVFGPEYARAVLAQEQSFLDGGAPQEIAESAAWVKGLSAKELRTQFPEALADLERVEFKEHLPPLFKR